MFTNVICEESLRYHLHIIFYSGTNISRKRVTNFKCINVLLFADSGWTIASS